MCRKCKNLLLVDIGLDGVVSACYHCCLLTLPNFRLLGTRTINTTRRAYCRNQSLPPNLARPTIMWYRSQMVRKIRTCRPRFEFWNRVVLFTSRANYHLSSRLLLRYYSKPLKSVIGHTNSDSEFWFGCRRELLVSRHVFFLVLRKRPRYETCFSRAYL